jgi:hypothetical protein
VRVYRATGKVRLYGGGVNPEMPAFRRIDAGSPRYYPLPNLYHSGAATANSIGINVLWAYGFKSPPWTATIEEIAVNITLGAAGGRLVAGLYDSEFSRPSNRHYPTTLLAEIASPITTTSGVKTASLGYTLEPDRWYWLAMNHNSSAVNSRYHNVTDFPPTVTSTVAFGDRWWYALTRSWTYTGTMPNPAPRLLEPLSTVNGYPILYARFS